LGAALDVRHGVEPGSFRDRTARVFYADGAVCRALTATAWEEWQSVSAARFFRDAMAHGTVVATESASTSAALACNLPGHWEAVLRHETLPFVSYPYEWCFGMLKEAALTQLELLASAFHEGFTLKDATPFNVQWRGTRPVFIDVASFVRWRPGTPWAGYRQFCQMFLYPLFLQAYKGAGFQPWLRGQLDGIRAEELLRLMSWHDRLRPGMFTHVVAQGYFQQRNGTTHNLRSELKRAGFDRAIVAGTIAKLQKLVNGLEWSGRRSAWTDYEHNNSYEARDADAKHRFVETALRLQRTSLVWDIGCNTGRFSKLAADHAACVVAMDSDHASIERLYRELRVKQNTTILPLVVDLADPSPALGWRGAERRSLAGRGRPDLVLCLAVLHHLAITSNIPVADFVDWLHELGGRLVIEFPTPGDPMVKRLLLNTDQAYPDYCVDAFERALTTRFVVHEKLTLPSGTRLLYRATPKKLMR
jgi:SAM-dependent methyltransferase